MNIVVDDTDESLAYSGQWTLFSNGSSRQWDRTIHSTFQNGAFVSFRFQGSVCNVFGTVPIGNGSTVLIDVNIDGSVSPLISRTTTSSPIFANLFYQSSAMESTVWHTVIITNRGGPGNVDFQFDRVELDAPDILPSIAPFAPAPPSPAPAPPSPSPAPPSASPTITHTLALTPSTPSTLPNSVLISTSTITIVSSTLGGAPSSSRLPKSSTESNYTSPSASVPIVTTDVSASVTTSRTTPLPDTTYQPRPRSTNTVPISTLLGIVGGIVGLFILIFFLFLCFQQWKVRNRRLCMIGIQGGKSQDRVVTPFTLGLSSSSSEDLPVTINSPARIPIYTAMSEKALLQKAHARANRFGDLNGPSNRADTFSNAMVHSGSPSTGGTGNISHIEAWSISPTGETASFRFPQAVYQRFIEPNRAGISKEPRYISGSTTVAGPSTSGYEGTTRGSVHDMLPAYRLNE